jgi:hypothetical protein
MTAGIRNVGFSAVCLRDVAQATAASLSPLGSHRLAGHGALAGRLLISAVFDLVSLHQSGHQMSVAARRANRILLESAATSDPTLRAVFLEDAVSILGDLLALVGLALNQITGSSFPQALPAVIIATVHYSYSSSSPTPICR